MISQRSATWNGLGDASGLSPQWSCGTDQSGVAELACNGARVGIRDSPNKISVPMVIISADGMTGSIADNGKASKKLLDFTIPFREDNKT
jgi:hypothetical protein